MNLRQLQAKKISKEKNESVYGKIVLITGRLPQYTRTTIERKIRELGGNVVDMATVHTNIVVYTRIDTSKYIQARRLSMSSAPHIVFVKGDDFITNYLKLESGDEDEPED